MKRLLSEVCAFVPVACAETQVWPSPITSSNAHEADVPGSSQWTDSGVDLPPDRSVTIFASEIRQIPDGGPPSTQGAARRRKTHSGRAILNTLCHAHGSSGAEME